MLKFCKNSPHTLFRSAWIDPVIVQVFALHQELTFHQIFLSIFLFSAMLCLAFSSVFHCFLCYSCQGTLLPPRPLLAPVLPSHQTLTLICSICISCQARLCRNRSAHLWQRCASYLLWILLHVGISIGVLVLCHVI